MRTVVSTILVGAFMALGTIALGTIVLGTGSALAKSPCIEEVKNIDELYQKVISRGAKKEKDKVRSAMTKIKGALGDGDEKTCHINANRIKNMAKRY